MTRRSWVQIPPPLLRQTWEAFRQRRASSFGYVKPASSAEGWRPSIPAWTRDRSDNVGGRTEEWSGDVPETETAPASAFLSQLEWVRPRGRGRATRRRGSRPARPRPPRRAERSGRGWQTRRGTRSSTPEPADVTSCPHASARAAAFGEALCPEMCPRLHRPNLIELDRTRPYSAQVELTRRISTNSQSGNPGSNPGSGA
jgi:hypothetical protein